jgi:hypothetical protein
MEKDEDENEEEFDKAAVRMVMEVEAAAAKAAAAEAASAKDAAIAAVNVAAAAKSKQVADWMAKEAEKRGSSWGFCEHPDCYVLHAKFNQHMLTRHPGVEAKACETCKKKIWWASAATVHECSQQPRMRHVVAAPVAPGAMAAERGTGAAAAVAEAGVPKVVAEWMAHQAEKRGGNWGFCEDCIMIFACLKKHMRTRHPELVPTVCEACDMKFWWVSAATVHECPNNPLKRHMRDVIVGQMISQQEILSRMEAALERLKRLAETDKINQD